VKKIDVVYGREVLKLRVVNASNQYSCLETPEHHQALNKYKKRRNIGIGGGGKVKCNN
jgi:hypothetical protein